MSDEAKHRLPSIGEIESITAKLREPQAGVEETFKKLDEDHRPRGAWKEACRRFQEASPPCRASSVSHVWRKTSHTLSKRRSGASRLILGSFGLATLRLKS